MNTKNLDLYRKAPRSGVGSFVISEGTEEHNDFRAFQRDVSEAGWSDGHDIPRSDCHKPWRRR